MTKEPHIGHLIKLELRNQGRTITWLAKQLECSRQNAYKILNRPWIYTDLLLKISGILDYDFFKCFSEYHQNRKELY
ncbi:MAG: XRE family transcriptional regulator [Bacteroidales bacterium]|nr:XRE family transcriptional regulator [Bacteroidales bacterium]MBO7529116.1 XRE family transcriptional regulator [Bacteroidales bacterium]